MASILEGIYNEIEEEYNDFNESEDFLDLEPEEIIINNEFDDDVDEDVIISPDDEVSGEEEEKEFIMDDEYFDFGTNPDIEEVEESEEEDFNEAPPINPEEVDDSYIPDPEDADENTGVKKPSEFTFTELKEFIETLTESEVADLKDLMTEEVIEEEVIEEEVIEEEVIEEMETVEESEETIEETEEIEEADSTDMPDSLKKEEGITDDSDLNAIMTDSVDYHLIGRNVRNSDSDSERSKSISNNLTNPSVIGVVITTPGVFFIKDEKKIPLNVAKGKAINVVDEDGNGVKITGTPSETDISKSIYVTDTTEKTIASKDASNTITLDNVDEAGNPSNVSKYSVVYGKDHEDYPIMMNVKFEDVWEDEILGVVLKSDENSGKKEYVSYEDGEALNMSSVEEILQHYSTKSDTDYYDVYLIIKSDKTVEEPKNDEVIEEPDEKDDNVEESLNESIMMNLDEAMKLTKSLEDRIIMAAAQLLIDQMK